MLAHWSLLKFPRGIKKIYVCPKNSENLSLKKDLSDDADGAVEGGAGFYFYSVADI